MHRLAAAIIMSIGFVVAAAPAPAPAQSGNPITPAEAKRVVGAYDKANTANNNTLDIEGQAAIETGPIQTIDDASFRDQQGRGASSLSGQFALTRVRVSVPEQSGYPLQFLAATTVDSGDSGTFEQLLVFTRATEGDPWKVSMAAQLPEGTKPPTLPTNRDGLARLLDADHAGDLVASPDALPKALADVYARAAGEERPRSKVFADGPFTDGLVDRLVGELAGAGIDGNVDFEFTPNDSPTVCYRAKSSGALCLFVVSVHESIQPNGSNGLVQPDSRAVFGGLVPPGQYGTVEYDRLTIVAATVPARSAKARAKVIGIYDGVVDAAGLPPGAITSA